MHMKIFKKIGTLVDKNLNIAISYVTFLLFLYGAFYTIFFDKFLPAHNLFSFFILFLASYFGGMLINFLGLPPLLGMLISGILFKNIKSIDISPYILSNWSVVIKSLSLVIILVHGALKCNTKVLLNQKWNVVKLSFIPCVTESLIVGVLGHFIMKLPWPWAFMLGFVMSPLSPAVIVPSLVKLQEQGYGITKGIPTLILVASGIDGPIAIMGFAISSEIALPLSKLAQNKLYTAFHGPLEIILGLAYGYACGIFLWYFPSHKTPEPIRSRFRFAFLCSMGVFAVFGGKSVSFSGAGSLGTLTLTLVACYGWFQRGNKYNNVVSRDFKFIWDFFQPLLFGLIGLQMDIRAIKPTFFGYCILLIMIGGSIRSMCAILCVFGDNFSYSEKIFFGITWTPKATVQAAIGSLALDTVQKMHSNDTLKLEWANMILVASIIVILVTAPLGAIAIDKSGPKLLIKDKRLSRENLNETNFDEKPDNVILLNKNPNSTFKSVVIPLEDTESHL